VTVEVHDAIGPVAAEWDALADAAAAAPFARPGWFAAWHDAFGSGRLLVLAVRRGSRLVGVLPVRRRGGLLASPTNAHTPAFELVAVDAAARRELIAALYALAPRRIELDYLDACDAVLGDLRAAAARRRHRLLWTAIQRSPYLTLTPGEDVDRRLPGKVARNLRRLQRRLAELGRIDVDMADGRRGLDGLLVEGFAIEPSGWKAERGTAILSSPATRGFYAAVARWAAAAGMLRLCFLRLDGRAAAFVLGLRDGGVFYVVKGGYDRALRRHAPGKLLMRALLADCAATGVTRVELLGAEEPWKREWTRDLHERLLVRSFAPTPLAAAERAAQAAYLCYGKPLARRAVARLR
jgi:CelD/BcsL family acetyltransferase involved in cellulose biosynthesis